MARFQAARKQLAEKSAELAERRQQLAELREAASTKRAQAEQDRTLLSQLLTQLRLVQKHHVEQEAELRVVFEQYYRVRLLRRTEHV